MRNFLKTFWRNSFKASLGKHFSFALSVLLVAGVSWWAHSSSSKPPAKTASESVEVSSATPQTQAHRKSGAKPQLPAAPTVDELKGTGLELSLSDDGHYQIAPKGGYRSQHDILIVATPEVWKGQEQNLLKEINGEMPEISEADEAVIAAWRENISTR